MSDHNECIHGLGPVAACVICNGRAKREAVEAVGVPVVIMTTDPALDAVRAVRAAYTAYEAAADAYDAAPAATDTTWQKAEVVAAYAAWQAAINTADDTWNA